MTSLQLLYVSTYIKLALVLHIFRYYYFFFIEHVNNEIIHMQQSVYYDAMFDDAQVNGLYLEEQPSDIKCIPRENLGRYQYSHSVKTTRKSRR